MVMKDSKKPPRPKDPIQLAKLVGDIATGQVKDNKNKPKPVKK
jgi:hypothetical protein